MTQLIEKFKNTFSYQDTDPSTYRFSSGLTYKEADVLVDRYVDSLAEVGKQRDPEFIIRMLKVHLARAVRDNDLDRQVISACIDEHESK